MPIFTGTNRKDLDLVGSAGDDVISGGEGGDVINGGAGNDVLYGYGASDVGFDAGAIAATRVASGLARPVFAASAPGDPNRLFIIEQHSGQIKILDLNSGQLLATPFLDIANGELTTGGEQGLLGLAFHPDYATNGRYYVYLTNASGDSEIWEYTRGGNADVSATTRNLVMTFDQPFETHNGGWMAFGPDGYLYISSGDGGGSNDPSNNAQNINTLLGKLLRIDVNGDDFPTDATRDYAIPASNPFAGATPGADEVFAYGLRNPWRPSFDTFTGDVFIADVGEGAREEVNFIPAGTLGGRNFGWVVMEGTQVRDTTRPGNRPANDPSFTVPVYDYPHAVSAYGGYSITGGYVLRGPDAGAQGLYVFGDFVLGNLWTLRVFAGAAEDVTNRNGQLRVNGGDFDQIASFALDGQGRLYVVGLDGDVHRLSFSEGAGDAADLISGGAGADQIYGGAGDDTLNGDADDDLLVGGIGADVLNGGTGNDTASYANAAGAVTVRLWNSLGAGSDAAGDVLTSIENLIGSSFNDQLEGNDSANAFYGGAGADLIYTSGGNDFAFGDIGDDALFGQDGDDALGGWDGVDWLDGGPGSDWLSGGAGNDRLMGAAGNDTLDGQAGADAMFGGTGDDTYYVDNFLDDVFEGVGEGVDTVLSSVTWGVRANVETVILVGTAAIDLFGDNVANVLVGNAGANNMGGYGGNDWMEGGGGNDWLSGGEGSDRLMGDAGADVLDGQAGADVLFGGADADIFFYGAAGDSTLSAFDSIRDFQTGVDRVNLSAVRTGASDTLRFTQAGGNTYLYIDLGGNGTDDMLIEFVGVTTVSQSDLIWGG